MSYPKPAPFYPNNDALRDCLDADGNYDYQTQQAHNDALQRDSYSRKDSIDYNNLRFDGQQEIVAYSIGSPGFGNVRNFRADGSEIITNPGLFEVSPDLTEVLDKQHQQTLERFNESPARARIRAYLSKLWGRPADEISASDLDSWIQNTVNAAQVEWKQKARHLERQDSYRCDGMATVLYQLPDGREVSKEEYDRIMGA